MTSMPWEQDNWFYAFGALVNIPLYMWVFFFFVVSVAVLLVCGIGIAVWEKCLEFITVCRKRLGFIKEGGPAGKTEKAEKAE